MTDRFYFEPFEYLYSRPSLRSCPLTFAVRGADPNFVATQLERMLDIIPKRPFPDEVVLVGEEAFQTRPPGRMGRLLLRAVTVSDARFGGGLEWLLANARWPGLVLFDNDLSVDQSTVSRMIESLEHADIVQTTRGPKQSWFRRWWSSQINGILDVRCEDPLSPVKAIRVGSFRGLPLQSRGILAEFEFLAKATFLASLLDDEIRIEGCRDSEPGLWQLIHSHGISNTSWLWDPIFWNTDSTQGSLRTRPQEDVQPEQNTSTLMAQCQRVADENHHAALVQNVEAASSVQRPSPHRANLLVLSRMK